MKNYLKATGKGKHAPVAFFQNTFSQFLILLLFALMVTGWSACGKGDDSPEPEDPCNGLECLNEGTLLPTCECQCPEWYEGALCEKQVTPDYIKIEKVTVNKFPSHRPDGAVWDANGSPPDPWLSIRRANSSFDIFRTEHIVGATAGAAYELTISNDESFYNVFESYKLYLWECDSGSDCVGDSEEMGQIDFKIYSSDNGFPDPLVLSNEDSTIEIELDLLYIPN